MNIRKAPETVEAQKSVEREQVFEVVREQVESFTLAQLDQEIEQLQRNIDAYQSQINELQAKKDQALAIDKIVEEIKP